jgi:hypothetical protein
MKIYHIAFCYASGHIGFGTALPDGALEITRHSDKQTLLKVVEGTARLAYDNKTWLVPGIPEASNENEKLKALRAYRVWVGKSLKKKRGR